MNLSDGYCYINASDGESFGGKPEKYYHVLLTAPYAIEVSLALLKSKITVILDHWLAAH